MIPNSKKIFAASEPIKVATPKFVWVSKTVKKRSPKMAIVLGFLLFFGLAGMGLPLTSGFPAEQFLLLGVFSTYKGAALLAMGGQILGAGYFLHYYRRAFLGPVTHRVVAEAEDLRPRERWVVLLFALPLLLSGIYPRWVLHFIQAPTTAWLAHFSGGGP